MKNLVYTHRGFPVIVDGPSDSVLEVAEIDDVLKERRHAETKSFEMNIRHVQLMRNIWNVIGNVFSNAMSDDVKVSGNVRSFILETASVIQHGKRRKTDITFWEELFTEPDDPTRRKVCNFSREEQELLNGVSIMKTEVLIQKWVMNAGVDDLVHSMHLIAGTIYEKSKRS